MTGTPPESRAPAEPTPAQVVPGSPEELVRVDAVDLGPEVGAWFTGRPAPGGLPEPAVGVAGNLSHRRPHQPARLAADRAAAAAQMDLAVGDLHLMQQVHGADVGIVDEGTPRGAEIRGVDALVTSLRGRALVVLVADCVPVLVASDRGPVAAVHAGRRGVELGVVPAALDTLAELGAPPESLSVAIGPAIGGCCYEVPAEMREAVAADHPAAATETSWGTPALDLPAAVASLFEAAGVARVTRVEGCTRCDPGGRWFSHRADAGTGRQAGVVVRRASAG